MAAIPVLEKLQGRKVFLSFDLDVVDPAFAPGVQTPEAGGPTAREILRLLRSLRGLCPEARVVLSSEHIRQATEFYEAGADFVYIPRLHSAAEIAKILREALEEGFPTTPTEAMLTLRERHEVLD